MPGSFKAQNYIEEVNSWVCNSIMTGNFVKYLSRDSFKKLLFYSLEVKK